MRIVCISDTHMMHRSIIVPDGDMLIHAGDLTKKGSMMEIVDVSNWMMDLGHSHKVMIPGNHDFCFQNETFQFSEMEISRSGTKMLLDSGYVVEHGGLSLNVYGTPWQPWYKNWAFNLRTEKEMAEKWKRIWPKTDILIVHGPPAGILDNNEEGNNCGSTSLRRRIEKVKPGLVVCGHIHENRGFARMGCGTLVVNASCVTRRLGIQNGPQFVVETENGKYFEVVEGA